MLDGCDDDGTMAVIEALMELPQSPTSESPTKRRACGSSSPYASRAWMTGVQDSPFSALAARMHQAQPATPRTDYLRLNTSSFSPIGSRDLALASSPSVAAEEDARAVPLMPKMPGVSSSGNTAPPPETPDRRPAFSIGRSSNNDRRLEFCRDDRDASNLRWRSSRNKRNSDHRPGSWLGHFSEPKAKPRRLVSVQVVPYSLELSQAIDQVNAVSRARTNDRDERRMEEEDDEEEDDARGTAEKILDFKHCVRRVPRTEPADPSQYCGTNDDELDGEPFVLESFDVRKARLLAQQAKTATETPKLFRRVSVVEPEKEDDRPDVADVGINVLTRAGTDEDDQDKVLDNFETVFSDQTEGNLFFRAVRRQVSPEPLFGQNQMGAKADATEQSGKRQTESSNTDDEIESSASYSASALIEAQNRAPKGPPKRNQTKKDISTPKHPKVAVPKTRPSLSANNGSTVSSPRVKKCNCKNSKCLKLYCDCFAASRLCDSCNCVNCHNNDEHEADRQRAIQAILGKNPNAFMAKITPAKSHTSGCHCKRSRCLKKYCECFEASVHCGIKCKCIDCENYPGSELLAQRRAQRRHTARHATMPKIDLHNKATCVRCVSVASRANHVF
ncbi:hypothetical protein CTAYLR_005713 [Chrysophaeum taylorii]|uniref:CRC domain-containing protein n=1 Tax=Chrysophaeum taylorii TaxID=2483200 RepID=A0AAD7UIY9_9STRA|nr:hypothetical protein CTAYLR_005713 [Chrysophaeum taylorii]